jgi:HEAT repeat protein
VIAHLDARDANNQAAIEKLLKDDDDWVRLNAAGSISLFGAKAKSALPALQECLESKDEGLKTSAQKAIDAIQAAKEDAAAERQHADTAEKIKKFVAARKQP